MSIFIGGTEVEDILIGNTQINEVYIGANLVWQRLTVTTDPSDGSDTVFVFDGNAAAQVDLTANRSVTWSFTHVSGTQTGLSYGSTSGTSTYVRLFRSQSNDGIGESQSVVDVTATIGNSTVTTRVTLSATVDTIGGLG